MKAATLVLTAIVSVQVAQFRAGVEAVRVDTLVIDAGLPVTGLTADDFELRDSGVVQTIESVAISDLPISLMIALDTSESVAGRTLRELKDGVGAAVAALRESDRTALITFSGDVHLRADWGGSEAVRSALAQVRATGTTSLWDASFAALTFSDQSPNVRRLVIVFSDGDDTSSWLSRTSAIEKARRTDAVVYAVEIRDAHTPRGRTLMNQSGAHQYMDGVPTAERPFLEELSQVSGGTRFRVDDVAELRKAFTRVLTEFRTRYQITYTAQGVEQAGWHALEVKLKTKRGKVIARRGYMR